MQCGASAFDDICLHSSVNSVNHLVKHTARFNTYTFRHHCCRLLFNIWWWLRLRQGDIGFLHQFAWVLLGSLSGL